MLKVDRMFLTLKMDRPIDTDKHYISPAVMSCVLETVSL